MTQPTFRIPGASVMLQADGAIVAKPAPGATVKDATLAMAPELTAAYVGKGLQLMSEPSLGDHFMDAFGAGDSTRAGISPPATP